MQPIDVPDGCPLTPRQYEVMRYLARGMPYKQIARRMRCAPSTVTSVVHVIYKRLDALSSQQATYVMLRNGWLHVDALAVGWRGGRYNGDGRSARAWVPSPAQRLYLDAVDRMLRERTDEATAEVAFYFNVLMHTAGAPVKREAPRSFDLMVLRLARGFARLRDRCGPLS